MNSASSRFDDGKDADALRTIGEVSGAFGIKQHVLRYWEQQFSMLQPLKRSGGRRYYRASDIIIVETIDRLVNEEGYTLKGACQAIESAKSGGGKPGGGPAEAPSFNHGSSVDDVAPQLRAIRDRLSAALR